MAKKTKIKNLLSDLTSSMRAEKRRANAIKAASKEDQYHDPIKALAEELHPAYVDAIITEIRAVSPTTKEFKFEREDGKKFPPFQCGNYATIELNIGTTRTSRPYSISSAPYEARLLEHPFITLTIRNGKPNEGFASSYLYQEAKVGDKFRLHVPYGFFYYEPLRDSSNVVALAGGSGITPFHSMAKEIVNGKLDIHLTILYGSVSHDDIIYEKELNELAKKDERIKLINVLSGKDAALLDGDEKGFLSKEIIQKYMGEDPTFFVCGPLVMYTFVLKELAALNIKQRRIHTEVFGAPRDVTKATGYVLEAGKAQEGEAKAYAGDASKEYQLTVVRGIDETVIPMKASEPVIDALERAAIPADTRCRSGACGYCRAKLLSGTAFVPNVGDGRRMADKEHSYIHSCSTYPLSDLTVKIDIE